MGGKESERELRTLGAERRGRAAEVAVGPVAALGGLALGLGEVLVLASAVARVAEDRVHEERLGREGAGVHLLDRLEHEGVDVGVQPLAQAL